MSIRIPNSQEHQAAVSSFRRSLGAEQIDVVVDRLLEQDKCFCLDAGLRQEISAAITTEFSGDYKIVFVGSAQFGFSLVDKGATKPRYRSFSNESDIDIAIVDSGLFDAVWRETFLYFIQNNPWAHVADFQKYFFRGWIRPDKLPYNSAFRSRWFDFFRALSRSQLESAHSVTCALYKENIFLTEYLKHAVKKCRDAEETR